ncbi:MAG: hypothetical protein Q9191_000013 [Dirinaria sp. TL-2023a]
MSTLRSEQVTKDDSDSVPFAKLIPLNEDAKKALHELMQYPSLSSFHRSFIEAERVASREEVCSASDTASGSSFRDESPSTRVELWTGHYALEFEKAPTIAWRVGKGSSKSGEDRGVDLLVCRPERGSKAGIAALHALIQFHTESGLLMLVGLSDSRPVEYLLDFKRCPLLLRHNEKHVLHQKVNRFSLGKLLFKLVYEDLDDAGLAEYTRVRNNFFKTLGRRIPHAHIHVVPQKHFHMIGSIILHQSLSCGTFGWVYAAVDSRTGVPLAVKELAIKDKRIARDPDLRNELEIATSFREHPGLLQAGHVQCDHGHPGHCGTLPEHVYMSFPLAIGDFASQNWSSIDLSTTIALLRGPLQGLKSLHEAGYMHRDVSVRNLLVMSLDPPEGVLCDYGKARRSLEEKDSRIGPIPTLAPEVDGEAYYDSKIDVWGIGYVCCCILFPKYQRQRVDNFRPPNRNLNWYVGLTPLLEAYQERGQLERSFGDLVTKMIAWEPKSRMTAAQALQHPCMQQDEPLLTSEVRPAKVVKTSQPAAEQALQHEEIATEKASDRAEPAN